MRNLLFHSSKVIKYVPDGIIHVLKIWGIYVIIKLSKKSGAGQKREGGKRFERRKD